MNNSIKVLISILLFCIGIDLQAQEAVSASSGNAAGSGGTVSYTIGQVAYTTNTGASGSITLG